MCESVYVCVSLCMSCIVCNFVCVSVGMSVCVYVQERVQVCFFESYTDSHRTPLTFFYVTTFFI